MAAEWPDVSIMKMMTSTYIYLVQLLSCLSCVNGLFSVNVAQEKYEAEENASVLLEWMFTVTSNLSHSLDYLFVYCYFLSAHEVKTLFELSEGVELNNRHQDFSGRVSCDWDILRQGRILLHLSELSKDDSGPYRCDVMTPVGTSSKPCYLNVTDVIQPFTPGQTPINLTYELYLYTGLALLVVAMALVITVLLMHKRVFAPSKCGSGKADN